jgi:OFA family oxalate/formate antiporter-like MFS transporter
VVRHRSGFGPDPRVLQEPEPPSVLALNPNISLPQNDSSSTSTEMLRSLIFWLLYAMFVGVSASGLMATAQPGPIAEDYRLSETTIMGANTLSVALVVDNVLKRLCPAILRRIIGPDRTRRDNGTGIHSGGRQLLVAGDGRAQSMGLRDVCGAHLLHVGRDFHPVPLHLHRYVWTEICHCQCQPPLYREGYRGFPRVANVVKSATGSWDVIFLFAAVTNVSVVLLACSCSAQCGPTGYGERGSPRSDRTRPRSLKYLVRCRIVGCRRGCDRSRQSADGRTYICYAPSP